MNILGSFKFENNAVPGVRELQILTCCLHYRDQPDWNQISNNVKPGGNFVVLDLEPATWYNLRVTAHNNAGFTVAEYEFATLTITGGK